MAVHPPITAGKAPNPMRAGATPAGGVKVVRKTDTANPNPATTAIPPLARKDSTRAAC